MKAAPTLDGRLRIDLESEADALVLMSIVADAGGRVSELSEDVAGVMPGELEEDWQEFVMPELRVRFGGQIAHVAQQVSPLSEGDTLFIGGDEAEEWFGTLNQARLALEARYHFASRGAGEADTEVRSAGIRSRFYLMLQGLILDFLMK